MGEGGRREQERKETKEKEEGGREGGGRWGTGLGTRGESRRLALAQVSLLAKVIRSRSPPGEGKMAQCEERPFPQVLRTLSQVPRTRDRAPAAIWLSNK